jgi:hypothetical protein
MAVDLATLGLRLTNAQAVADAKATGAAFEEMGQKGERAALKLVQSTNPVTEAIKNQTVASVSATRGMSAWGAVQAEAAGRVGEHSLSIGRLGYRLESLTADALGANSAVGLLGASFLKFGVGDIYMVAILGGIYALVEAYKLLTASGRELNKQIDDMTKSLVEQAKAAHAATLSGANDLKLVAELQQQIVQGQSGRGVWSVIAGALMGAPTGITTPGDKAAHDKRLADAQTAVEQATANYDKIWSDTEEKRTRKLEEEERKRLAAARQRQEQEIRFNELMARTYGGAPSTMTSAQRADWLSSAHLGTMSDTERNEAMKTLGVGQIPGFSMPNVGGIDAASRRLIDSFDHVTSAAKKVADAYTTGRKELGDFKESWKRGNIMGGVEAGGALGLGDALSQFTPQALATRAVTSGINYIVQGFTDMALRMVEGGAAAREYARALRQQKDEYAAAIAQYGHDDLAAALASNMAASEQLRKQLQDLITWRDALKDPAGTAKRLKGDDITALEAKNAEIIRRQAVYAQEDLAVRNLRATGQGDAANLLAFREQQQREMQKAIDDNKDALYINTLTQTQANELLAYNNGLLSTALRNAPTGFYGSAAYIGAYASPRGPAGYPTDGGISGGGADTGAPGRSPPGNRGPITIVLQVDGKVLTRTVVNGLDQNASATGGAGTSRAAALETYR